MEKYFYPISFQNLFSFQDLLPHTTRLLNSRYIFHLSKVFLSFKTRGDLLKSVRCPAYPGNTGHLLIVLSGISKYSLLFLFSILVLYHFLVHLLLCFRQEKAPPKAGWCVHIRFISTYPSFFNFSWIYSLGSSFFKVRIFPDKRGPVTADRKPGRYF